MGAGKTILQRWANPKEATQKDKKGPIQGEKVAKRPPMGRKTWQKSPHMDTFFF